MKVLVIAAHPDDEVLGCGGTMARLAKEGAEVHIAILGEGLTSRYGSRERTPPAGLQALHRAAKEAARQVGAKPPALLQLPDNRFDTLPLLEIVTNVEELIARLRPECIYTHHAGDLNVDHQLTHRAVLTATRPLSAESAREIFAFEIPSSTEWAFQSLGPAFRPNVFVDISGTLEIKLRAMACYETEQRDFPHPRSRQALQAIAHRWGSVAGVQAAEAFELVRALR